MLNHFYTPSQSTKPRFSRLCSLIWWNTTIAVSITVPNHVRTKHNQLKIPKTHYDLGRCYCLCSSLPWCAEPGITIYCTFAFSHKIFQILISDLLCVLPYLWQQPMFDSNETIWVARCWLFGGNTGCKSVKQTRGIIVIYVSKFWTFQYDECVEFSSWVF